MQGETSLSGVSARWRLPGALRLRAGTVRRHLTGHGFVRNVLVMLAGTTLGQGASVLLSPVLTRIYDPAEFGYLSVYTAAVMILSVVASLRYEMALPLAASETEASNLLALCGLALAGTTLGIGLLAWLVPGPVLSLAWLGPLAAHRWLVPLGFLLLGGYYVVLYLATRLGAFADIARTRISQGLAGPLSQIGLGLAGFGAPGLAIGFVIGQSSGTFLLFSRLVLRRAEIVRTASWSGILAAARRYGRFPLFSSWSALLDTAGSGSILFLLFTGYYSTAAAGFIFLSERVIARPLLMVSTSVLQVYVGEAGAAVKQDPARLRRRFWQVLSRQGMFAAGWILFANLVAGRAFPLLFGAEWGDAAVYLRALSLGYLTQATLHPVSHTLQILERQALAAAWQIARLVLVILSIVLAAQWQLPAVQALWAYSLVQAVACVVMTGLIVLSIERIQIR